MNMIAMGVIKTFLQVVSLVFLTFILVSKNFDLMLYVYGLLVLLFILLGYEEIKMKKNLGNGLTILSAVIVMTLFLTFSFI